MIKTIPLMLANIKGFVRNWKSVLLLIVFPLILISVVFLSFNTEGLRKLPVGVIETAPDFNLDQFSNTYLSYLIINKFSNTEDCMSELRAYRVYACIDIVYETAHILKVRYDNTRDPIIWELLERLKGSIDFLQKAKSKSMASDFITKFRSSIGRFDSFSKDISGAKDKVDSYITTVDKLTGKLQKSKAELSSTLNSMDKDIAEVKSLKNTVKTQKDDLITNLGNTPVANEFSYLVNPYNQMSNNYLYQIDGKINNYEQMSKKGRTYLFEIDEGIVGLSNVRMELNSHKAKIQLVDQETSKMRKDLEIINNFDPELLVNPIILRNTPTYIPDVGINIDENKEDLTRTIIKGMNMINLQILFPNLLLLITLFLSLLISSFISITEINSSAHQRICLIRGVFFHEAISLFISSLIITTIPILCVLALGNFFFQIPIFSNIGIIGMILLLVSSSFILIGMGLSYLIKKESITMLIISFILVFFIFFSGFLLPVERMRELPGTIATYFPLKVSLSAFNKAIFYGQEFSTLTEDISILAIWFVGLAVLVLIIKRLRNL